MVEQKLTEADLSGLSRKHKIPFFVNLVPIGLGQSVVRPPKGMIALCTKHLESSLTLPSPDIIHNLDTTPGHLNPNAWKAIIGFIILWKREGFSPFTFSEFRCCYGIRKYPYTGFFYAFTLPHCSFLITKIPSYIKNSKYEFLFVKGDWGASFGLDSPDYKVRWWFKRNHKELSKRELVCTLEQIERFIQILSTVPSLRTSKLMVTS